MIKGEGIRESKSFLVFCSSNFRNELKKKTKTNIPQKNKVRSELQKEIDSICPFCDSEEVGHFEIHHIDENPSNHVIENLILVCPTCHSKITKEDILQREVIDKKRSLKNRNAEVQFISVHIDEENCGWKPIENTENSFEAIKLKSLFPIFIFSLTNHTSKTVLLTSIKLRVKRLPVGLSGPYIPLPNIPRPLITYKIRMPLDEKEEETKLKDEIEVPSTRNFKFKIEVFTESMENFSPQYGRFVLFFEFGFNNDFYIKVPMILLNSKQYYEELELYRLG